jgi:hypothetical protein
MSSNQHGEIQLLYDMVEPGSAKMGWILLAEMVRFIQSEYSARNAQNGL